MIRIAPSTPKPGSILVSSEIWVLVGVLVLLVAVALALVDAEGVSVKDVGRVDVSTIVCELEVVVMVVVKLPLTTIAELLVEVLEE